MSEIVLSCQGLVKRFGGIVATNDVSLDLRRGARHALIGPNGAGKTTLINLLTGVIDANSWLIWKVRTMPRRTRWCGASCVMSWPSSAMRPAVASSTPVSRLISVVLPAPLGPISA